MKRPRTIVLLAMVLAFGLGPTLAGKSSTFDSMLTHYESIRQALVNDGTEDVADNARRIQHLVHALEAEFSAEAAGIRPDTADDLRPLLPSIREAAEQLAGSASIAEARESFGKLSKALVQYRQMIANPSPVVAFCSMVDEVWLQPKGEIGNPYFGQSMATCGEFISE